MESLTPSQSPPIPAAFEAAFSPPCHGNFEGLNAAERRLHAEILCRAHSIWECKGRPDNSELADWLEAEAEVTSESQAERDPQAVRNP